MAYIAHHMMETDEPVSKTREKQYTNNQHITMKLSFYAAALLLTAASAATMVTACGDGDKNGADSSLNVKGQQQGKAFETSINIRYVDMDSLLKHYDYCLDQEAKVSQIEMELQQYQNQLARNLQVKQNAIQQKAQANGYLSEASYKADLEEYAKLEQASSAQLNRRMQADQQRVIDLKQAYITAIQDYIVEYNADKKYDAILHKDAGLYFNPALDITGEVLAGLNQQYKAKKDAAKKDTDKAAEDKK